MNHVRADRWYKLGRTILYGRLEDEAPFQSVRRLVQYEDYTLRLMRDVGLPTAQPMGIVELTPEREYLLVTEFFDGAKEIGDADVDDQVIDEGLSLVRRLWQAGLAHRDIKPANLMVRDGHVMLIDVAFAQVRPSPWRQAIDLANMMLVLAVRTDAERVYQRALDYFTPDEIAEAFAAARGVASPTQLRTVMKQDGRDLVAEFRALAPERRPISLQRWGPKRILLAVGLALAAVFVLTTVYSMFTPADLPVSAQADVRHGRRDDPDGPGGAIGRLGAVHRRRPGRLGRRRRADQARSGAVPARGERQRGRGHAAAAGRVLGRRARRRSPSDEVGMRRFEAPEQLPPSLRITRTYLFEGGCVTYRFEFERRRRRLADPRRRCGAGVPAAGRTSWARSTNGRATSACAAPTPRRAQGRNSDVIVAASVVVILLRVVVGLALAAVVTSLSLRLLGIRRGWGSALLAGVIGWSLAVVVSLGLNDWDWGADGLVLHMLAIGIPTTMAVAVTLDLLARPGSLALGERAGLVVAPRPLRAIRMRVSVLRRYRELVRLGRREGFGPFMSATDRAQRTAESTGIRLRRVLEEAGGVYIKLGQIAATRVDLLPAEVCEQLAGLQNDVAPETREDVAAVLEAELGATVDKIFAEFEWEPLAAASIGQTHVARLRSGEPVVVKVQRPAIGELMERDLAALALVADVAQRRTQFGLGLRVAETLAQFAENLRSELDFLREADAMSEMKARLDSSSPVRIPRVHRELCTRRVLIQERFDGFTVSDAARLEASGVDRSAVADQLLRATFDQILRIGFFHADPHPGNVFVFADGTLGLIDFGAVGRLDPIQQSAVVDIFIALARRDVSLLRDGVERVADVTETASPDELERSLARLMADHLRPSGAVDPRILQDLVATLSRFGLRLPTDVVLLSRALATVDGTLRAICPEMSLMTAATGLMQEPATDQVVDRQQMVKDEVIAALPHLRRLPERVDRILSLAGRGDLRVRNVVDEDRQRILRTLTNRLLLAAIGAAFLLASAILLVATDDGPGVAEATGLFEIFGYGGLLVGTVLLLRVAAAVARDGTT